MNKDLKNKYLQQKRRGMNEIGLVIIEKFIPIHQFIVFNVYIITTFENKSNLNNHFL